MRPYFCGGPSGRAVSIGRREDGERRYALSSRLLGPAKHLAIAAPSNGRQGRQNGPTAAGRLITTGGRRTPSSCFIAQIASSRAAMPVGRGSATATAAVGPHGGAATISLISRRL